MSTLFPDYEKLVLEDYYRKKSLDILSSGLTHITRAKLKKECIRLCQVKIHSKDEKVIRDFCEEPDDKKNCLEIISKYDVDKFRPLSDFLKGDTDSTDPINIQLLAWLIDFPLRPYDFTKNYSPPIDTPPEAIKPDKIIKVPIDETQPPQTEKPGVPLEKKSVLPSSEVTTKKWRFHKISVLGFLLVVIGIGGYFWLHDNKNAGCMYWTGDHYQPIPCNQSISNTLVIALDSAKVKNFKKIMTPDTISHRSKGWVWYSKIGNKLEYFTSDGDHPVLMSRHLKPISDHIIDTYIHPTAATIP